MGDRRFDREAFYEDVGERLRVARHRRGLTQQDVADVLDVPRSTYANIERAGQRAPVDIVWRVAHLYGVPVDDLLPTPKRVYSPLAKGNVGSLPVPLTDDAMSPSDAVYRGTAPPLLTDRPPTEPEQGE